jgi:hypothetical protein
MAALAVVTTAKVPAAGKARILGTFPQPPFCRGG